MQNSNQITQNNDSTNSEVSVKQQTINALQTLASYFSVQFVLTENTKTGIGYVTSFFWAQPKYQGLSSVSGTYESAIVSFKEASSCLMPINTEKFNETGKAQFLDKFENLKYVAPGNRYHLAMNKWLSLYQQTTLDDTKAFIQQSQEIFKQQPICISDQGTPDDSIAMFQYKGDRTIYFKNATDISSTAFIRGFTYDSIFDAMLAVPLKYTGARPEDTETAKPTDFQIARLLSNTAQKPEPTELEAFRTLENILTLYPKMFIAVSKAAKKTSVQLDPENFTMHCAMIEALILAAACKTSENRTKLIESFLTIPASEEIGRQIEALTEQLKNLNSTLTNNKPSFKQAGELLKDIIAPINNEAKTFTKAQLVGPANDFVACKDNSTENLLTACIEYIEALGAKLSQSMYVYQKDSEITSQYDPTLALETIKEVSTYISSNAFKAKLPKEADCKASNVVHTTTENTANTTANASSTATDIHENLENPPVNTNIPTSNKYSYLSAANNSSNLQNRNNGGKKKTT